jgi:hypothetical protein
VSFYDIPVTGKRLALLHELVPTAEVIAVLQDPNSATFQTESREIETTVRALGQKIIVVKAAANRKSLQPFRPWQSRVPERYWSAEVHFLTPIDRACRSPRNPGELCVQRLRRRPAD